MIRNRRDIEARIETHRIDLGSHPVIEVPHPSQVAEQVLGDQKLLKLKFPRNYFFARNLDSLMLWRLGQLQRVTSLVDAKQQADLFKYLAKSRNPLPERLLGFVPAI